LGKALPTYPFSAFSNPSPRCRSAHRQNALDSFSFTLFRSELTRSSDTAEALLKRLGIADQAAPAFLRSNPEARSGILSRPGRTITAEATQESKLQRLSARWIPDGNGGFQQLIVERKGTGLRCVPR